jgi:hypothetical protein
MQIALIIMHNFLYMGSFFISFFFILLLIITSYF